MPRAGRCVHLTWTMVVRAGSRRSSSEYQRIAATSSSVSARLTLPGLPMTSDRGGMRVPSVSSVPAATIESAPTCDAVQQDRAHADEHAILDGAAMHDRAVPDR